MCIKVTSKCNKQQTRIDFEWIQMDSCQNSSILYTYLFLLLVEIVNNNTDEEIQGEERAKDYENNKI